MRKIIPSYCKNFKCSASSCSDNCCLGWEIYIDNTTADYYKSVSGEFGEFLRKNIHFDEECHFILGENKRCPFLNKDNLCDIYINIGEDHMADICKMHPRFFEWFNGVIEVGVGLCCEEAARLLFESDKPITFETIITDEISDFEDYDEYFYKLLLRARKIMFSITQNRNYTLNKRLVILLAMAHDLQKCIENENYDLIDVVNTQYTSWRFCDRLYNTINTNYETTDKKSFLKELLVIFDRLYPINDDWIKHMKNIELNIDNIIQNYSDFMEYYNNRLYEYENLMVYFIYRYFMKSVFDYDVLSKIKFVIIGYLMISIFDVYSWLKNDKSYTFKDRITNVKMYSKDIEYAQLNIDSLADEGYINPELGFDSLVGVIK